MAIEIGDKVVIRNAIIPLYKVIEKEITNEGNILYKLEGVVETIYSSKDNVIKIDNLGLPLYKHYHECLLRNIMWKMLKDKKLKEIICDCADKINITYKE